MCQTHIPQKGYSKPDNAYKHNNVCTAAKYRNSSKNCGPLNRDIAQNNIYAIILTLYIVFVNTYFINILCFLRTELIQDMLGISGRIPPKDRA